MRELSGTNIHVHLNQISEINEYIFNTPLSKKKKQLIYKFLKKYNELCKRREKTLCKDQQQH